MSEKSNSKKANLSWFFRAAFINMVVCDIVIRLAVNYSDLKTQIYYGPFMWIWPYNFMYISELRSYAVSPDYTNAITISLSLFLVSAILLAVLAYRRMAIVQGIPSLTGSSGNQKGSMILGFVLPLAFLLIYHFGINSSSAFTPSTRLPVEFFTFVVELFMLFPILVAVAVIRFLLPHKYLAGFYYVREPEKKTDLESQS